MALLGALGIGVGVTIAVGLLVMLVLIVIAVVRMAIVTAMQWRDVFSLDRWTEVMVTIGRNKLRTALTMLSVVWGIFVMVFLLGLGNGLDNGIRKQFAREATNGVWVWANKTSVAHAGYDVGRRIMLDNSDYDRAKKVTGIDHISGTHFIKGQRWGGIFAKRGGKANTFEVNAVHADAFRLAAHDITHGRFLSESDIAQRRKSVVIGRPVAEFLFEAGENPIGEWIVVGGVAFQVVGVFTDPGGNEAERQIYIPVSTAQLAFSGEDDLGMLQFTVGQHNGKQTQAIIDVVVGQLAEHHKFDPDDRQAVRVHNNVEGFERFMKIFWMIATFTLVIGLGTLAAGIIGVSNIMMIAVKERTKEIGVRKALGATPGSVVFMIIQEAVFLTSIAGLLGLAAGVGALGLVGRVNSDFLYNPSIDLTMGILATLGLVFAGALAGYVPARAAARVNPIHALRDE